MVKVLVTGQKHLSIPNLPRSSKHTLIRSKPFPTGRYPLEKIWRPLSSVSYYQPFWTKIQVIHAFNSILYTNKPWFITFEDHLFLYRNYHNKLESLTNEILNNRLGLKNCKKLIAISDYAKMRCLTSLEKINKNLFDKIINKVVVIHPNFPVRAICPKSYKDVQRLQVVFIGNHVARKGGVVALRLAKKIEKLGLPVDVHIISQLKHGPGVPTDFPDKSKYIDDLKLLDLPNVTYYKNIPNEKVLQLLSQSHFQILATLHDTYGYSVIEGFSVATPAITTNVCALPEVVHPGKNGYFLPLALSEIRHWNNWLYEKVNTQEYWEILNSTYEQLADKALQVILEFLDRADKSEHYEFLSTGALQQAKNVNNSQMQNQLFDNLYAEAAGEC